MIQNLEQNEMSLLPLGAKAQSVLIPNFLRKETEFLENELYDFANFSIYQETIKSYSDILCFTDTVEILRMYINVNDFSKPPILFSRTIYKILLKLIFTIQEIENFITSKENLLSLEKLVEIFPMLINIIKIIYDDNASNCLILMDKIIEKITYINKRISNITIENILYYVNAYKRLQNSENKRENNNKNNINIYENGKGIEKIKNLNDCKDSENNEKREDSEKREHLSIMNSHQMNNQDSSDTSINKTLLTNKSQHPSLVTKCKKFNNNHFDRKTFIEKFLSCSSFKESVIHQNTKRLAIENYENKSTEYKTIIDYLDFSELRELINKSFNLHSIYLIGSTRAGLLTNISGRKTTIDMLLLPNVYGNSTNTSKPVSSHDFLYNLGSLESVLNKLNSLNTSQKTYEFLNLDSVKDEDLNNLFFNFDLKNKRKLDLPSVNVNFIIYDEKLKMSSDLIGRFFYKNENLQCLHMFFQEILISKLKLLTTRRDLSNLIIAFLSKRENIFHTKQVDKKCYYLKFKDKHSYNFRSSSLGFEQSYCSKYDILEKFKKDPSCSFSSMSLGELVIEFLRFLLNYIQYIKNDFNKTSSKNFICCKGFEYLDEEYKVYKEEKFQYNVLDHTCLMNIYNISKINYDFQFCKQVEVLEEVYFKLIECSDKIFSFNHLLENIKQI